jgi:peptidoglycan/LPS O-acetylase OafA/YrhL
VSASAYRRDIDGLRGIAILAVLMFHAFPSLVSGGFVGVDVFFVISGYLISGILLRELQDNRFSIRRFYARRVRRIFPALATVLLATWAAGWLILFPNEYSELGKHIGASSLFVSNIVLWKEAGYFDRAAELKPLLHLWSLAVEEQFYILLPPLLYAIYRGMRRPMLLLALIGLASLLANMAWVGGAPSGTFYLLPTRFWQLLMGTLIAYGQHQSLRIGSTKIQNVVSVIGVSLLLLAMFGFTNEMAYPSWRALLPTLGASLVIIAGHECWMNRRVFSSTSMVALGLISYPLYLWHWPLLAYARLLQAGEPTALIRLGAVSTAIMLAWLTYRFIERPIRFGQYRASPTIIRNLLLAMLVIGGVGGITWHVKGFAQQRPFNAAMMEDTEKLDDFRAQQLRCAYPFSSDLNWCLQSRKDSPSIAIFGDSHADHLFAGVVGDSKRSWLLIGQSSCPPAEGLAIRYMEKHDECIDKNEQILETLENSPNIKTVVLAARGMAYMAEAPLMPNAKKRDNPANWHSESRYADEAGLNKTDLLFNGLERSMTRLQKAGKQVVLFMDVPELDFLALRCAPRPVSWLAPKREVACSMPKEATMRYSAAYREGMLALAKRHPNVRLYDPAAQLCDSARCYAGNETMLFYRDNNHLSQRGSQKVMADFMRWLEK